MFYASRKRSSNEIITEEVEEDQETSGYTDIDDEYQIWEDDIENDDSNDTAILSEETANRSYSNDNSDYDDTYSEDSGGDEKSQDYQSKHDNYNENRNQNTLISNSKEFIFNLLQRVRKLINSIHKSSNLDRYVREQIYFKQEEANKRAKEDDTVPIVYNELVVDFRVRWNSTCTMVYRFNLLSSIVNDITFTPKNIDGMASQQVSTLSKLSFSHDDWNWLSALDCVLQRFEKSICLLSGRTYPTLALGYMILRGLKHFLSNHKPDEPLMNRLKVLLLEKFEHYCERNFSPEVEEAIMVSILY